MTGWRLPDDARLGSVLRARLSGLDRLEALIENAAEEVRAARAELAGELHRIEAVEPAQPPGHPDPGGDRMTLSGYEQHQVEALLQELDGAAEGFVTLGPEVTVVLLGRVLPRPYHLQPDRDGANERLVLLYRCATPAGADAASRLSYRLVDALALLNRSGMLDADLLGRLERTLPLLAAVPREMHEHVLARARWRCRVPARQDDVRSQLAQAGGPRRSGLAEQLALVVRDLPSRHEALAGVTRRLGLLPPTASGVPAASGVAATASAGVDMSRIASTRQDSERAREALLLLEAQHAGLQPEPSEPEPARDGELPAPLWELAELLAAQEQHSLRGVRMVATALGLVPLDAARRINEWAERRWSELGRDLDTVMVEIDEDAHQVWVDPALKELLT